MPPHISVREVMQKIKGKTSRKMLTEFRRLSRLYWGRHQWARGYFASSSGNVTDEVILQYIQLQDVQECAHDDDFTLAQV
jgi:putative transposase